MMGLFPSSLVRLRVVAGATITLAAATGCAGSGEVVRPENPTAADARGSQSVVVVEAPGQPLVVDWQPEQRGDLEVAMREGVAVVGFGPKGLRLLPDCHIDGAYGFIGVNTKEQVVRLLSGEEVRANLAADALGIISKLGAELGTSQALDIAIVMVGKRKTTWSQATRADLQGRCDGATHFVRGATIGAFAMRSGAKGQARTVAEIFGSGGSATTGSEKTVQNADGLLDACRKASPEADSPPPQCGALIRLELIPLEESSAEAKGAGTADGKAPDLAAEKVAACPAGLVFADGKCTTADAAPHHVCAWGDAADCATQCEKGNGASCDILGSMHYLGDGVGKDRAKAAALYEASCKLGHAEGCGNQAIVVRNGDGTRRDPPRAIALATAACRDGVARACTLAGTDLFFGEGVPADTGRAVQLMEAGCQGGDQNACSSLGVFVLGRMGGLAYDERRAAGLFKRACDGGVVVGCTNYGYMVEFGKGVPKDLKLAARIYAKACADEPAECIWTGILAQGAIDRTYDPMKARGAFETTCKAAAKNPDGTVEAVSCVVLNEVFGAKVPVSQAGLRAGVLTWKETCPAGAERDCTLLGLSALGLGDLELARKVLAEACKMGDAWACSLRGHPKLK